MSLMHPDLLPAMELLRENRLVCIVQREDGEGEVEAIYLSIVRPDGTELCMIRLPNAAESDTYGEDVESDAAADEQFVSLGRLFEASPHLASENKALKLALGEAAGEIYCSGPVAHRIRVLKGHHHAQVGRLIDERDAAIVARDKAIQEHARSVDEYKEVLSKTVKRIVAAEAEIDRLRSEYAKRNDLPIYLEETDLQELADIHLNPFAIKLLIESYNGHGEWKGLRPYRFRFVMAGVEVYLGQADRAAGVNPPPPQQEQETSQQQEQTHKVDTEAGAPASDGPA